MELTDIVREGLEADTALHEKTTLAPEDFLTLLDRCLSCTYFVCQGEYYLQIHGAVMGSQVSAIVWNLYKEWFEKKLGRCEGST